MQYRPWQWRLYACGSLSSTIYSSRNQRFLQIMVVSRSNPYHDIFYWLADTGEPIAEGIKNLAARLNDTLAPLFSCLNRTWPGVDEHIQKAFEYALKLKADLRFDLYMVLPYRPGSRFNEGTMVSHLGSGVQGRFVDLCVQPALFCGEDGSPLDGAHTAVKAVVAFLERWVVI